MQKSAAVGVSLFLLATSLQVGAAEVSSVSQAAPAAQSDPREALRQPYINSFTKGTLTNIVIRGYQRENIMVVFDDATYFGASPIRIDAAPYQLLNSDIQKIVVTPGPFNLAYPGGGGGVIEVISPTNPQRFSGRATFSYASAETVDGRGYVSMGNQHGDLGAGYLGRAGSVPYAGHSRSFTSIPFPQANNNYRPGSDELSMYRMDSFWLRGGINFTPKNRFELSYSYLQGTGILAPNLNFDSPYQRMHRLNGNLTLRDFSSLIQEIKLQGWWSQAENIINDSRRETADSSNSALPYRTFLNRSYSVENDLEATTVGGRAVATLKLGDGQLKSGFDTYQRSWNGTYSSLLKLGSAPWQYYDGQRMVPDVTTSNFGVFAIYEAPFGASVRTVVGLRGDISRVEASGLTTQSISGYYQPYYPGRGIPTGRDYANLSATAQLFWKPVSPLELFFKLGRAPRLPDPHELYVSQVRTGSNLLGNPFLRPSNINEVDGGFTFEAGKLSGGLTLFYSIVENMILPAKRADPDGTGVLQQARSAGNLNATLWGVELQAAYQLPWDLSVSGFIAYHEGKNRTAGVPLAEMPPLRSIISLKYDNKRFFASISEMLVARQNRFDPALNETSMPGFATTELRFGMRYEGLSVTAGINNLFDAYYVNLLSYQRDPISMSVRHPDYGRTVFVQTAYRF